MVPGRKATSPFDALGKPILRDPSQSHGRGGRRERTGHLRRRYQLFRNDLRDRSGSLELEWVSLRPDVGRLAPDSGLQPGCLFLDVRRCARRDSPG